MNAPPQRVDRDDPVVEPLGPGPRLRAARERIDMSLEDIGERLHLHTSTIEALETNAYALLPAPTFVRGYLRGYARLVGLAPEPVVDEFDSQGLAPPALVADISEGPQARTSDLPMRLATWAIFAALVILVVMWWKSQSTGLDFSSSATGQEPVEAQAAEPPTTAAMPESPAPAVTAGAAPDESTGTAADPADTSAVTGPGAEASAGTPQEPADTDVASSDAGETPPGTDGADPARLVQAAPESAETAAALATATAASTAMATVEAAPPPSAPQPAAQFGARAADTDPAAETVTGAGTSPAEPAQSTLEDAPAAPLGSPTVAAAPIPSEQAAAPPATARAEGEERLDLRFDAESWVEIYDRNEQRLYFNLVQPGAEIAVAGPGPLRVLLGRAEGVVARHNGAPFDVTPFIAKGIARFSVGASAPTQ